MSSEPPEVIIYNNKKKFKVGKKKKHTSFDHELSSINSFSPSRSESISSIDDDKEHSNVPSSHFMRVNNNQQLSSRPISPAVSESNSSVNDDNNIDTEQSKTQTPSMFSRAYVQPTEILSNYLFDGDDPDDLLDVDETCDPLDTHRNFSSIDNSESYNEKDQPVIHFTKPFDGFQSLWITDEHSREVENFDDNDEDESQDEESSEHEENNREPQLSLFNQTPRRALPWKKNSKLGKINEFIINNYRYLIDQFFFKVKYD